MHSLQLKLWLPAAVTENPGANEKAPKKILLVSHFLYQAAGDADDPFLHTIVERLAEKQILLEVQSSAFSGPRRLFAQ